jgi:hypothetical protein
MAWNMNEFQKIYLNVRQNFDSLWTSKLRNDNVIEIITPYSTTSNKFVSLFITKRNGKFIVSDGGLLNSESYGSEIDHENQCLLKVLYHMEGFYEVKTVIDKRGLKHYYKSTPEEKLVPNLVYEMAQYVSMCVSAATVPFVDEKEKEEKATFRRQVNTFLASIISAPNSKLNLNGSLDKKNFRSVTFNAIVTKNNSLSLVNYITGSSVSYFTKSISNASVLFEIADSSPFKDLVTQKVAVINNEAEGFIPGKLQKHFEILNEHTGREPIRWSERDELRVLLN